MKMKKGLILFLLLLFPVQVFALSDFIIPGGRTIGIEVSNEGIIIVGFYRVGRNLNRNNLRIGDTIVRVNDEPVHTINDFINAVEDGVTDNEVNITVKRNTRLHEIPFQLVLADGVYKTGLYVKDSVTGIGTLTYIDPATMIYGALGHEITESSSGRLIEVREGQIFQSSIVRIDPSVAGRAGTKHARFQTNNNFGNVTRNSRMGIYGIYTGDISNYQTIAVGRPENLEEGSATIYTVLKNEEVTAHEIYINNINFNGDTKNIHFDIISEELKEAAGGIVQGMSGSPIIQNNQIFGAVTHVIVDNPTSGYGIFITTMLAEGER